MKKKHSNRFLTVVCSVVMILSVSVTSFAQTPMASSEQAVQSSSTFEVLLQPSEQDGLIHPNTTWEGSGGFSRLDYMSKYKGFSWSIDVTETSVLPLTFSGDIEIRLESTGAYKGAVSVAGSGPGYASGTTYGSFTPLNLKTGIRYIAYFSGTAVNTAGQSFHVVDGAHMGFTY